MSKQLEFVYKVVYDWKRCDGSVVSKMSQAFATEDLAVEYKFYLDKIPYVISSYVATMVRV